jgi:hypothetical protein
MEVRFITSRDHLTMPRFDEVAKVIAVGECSTVALHVSTEQEQFK